ncbi:hypothetical protein [Nocardioides pacificus]
MTAFLVVAGIGMALLAVSLLLGEILGGVADMFGGDWFSGEVVGAFISALGLGGALAQSLGAPMGLSVAVGVGSGVVFGAFALWLTRLVRSGGTDEIPGARDVVGLDATIVSGIPADGFGVVDVRAGGHVLRFNARADNAIDPGTPVHVTGVLSPTAVTVAPVWNELENY